MNFGNPYTFSSAGDLIASFFSFAIDVFFDKGLFSYVIKQMKLLIPNFLNSTDRRVVLRGGAAQ
jgi:hypothetical protein